MKRNYINIGILVAIVIAIFAVSRVGHTGYPTIPSSTSPATTTTAMASFSQEPSTAAPTPRQKPTTQATSSSTPSLATNISLIAGSSTYRTYISNDESVLDLMRALSSGTSFTFTGENYPSLGFFVESINGAKNADGKYWILYINGKSSDVGASNAVIRSGDTVEWRFEKSY